MIKVSVCGGLGCRMFGSGDTLERLREAIVRRGAEDRVEVGETFCMGECSRGPCVRVNGVKFRHVSPDEVDALIEREILPLLG